MFPLRLYLWQKPVTKTCHQNLSPKTCHHPASSPQKEKDISSSMSRPTSFKNILTTKCVIFGVPTAPTDGVLRRLRLGLVRMGYGWGYGSVMVEAGGWLGCPG